MFKNKSCKDIIKGLLKCVCSSHAADRRFLVISCFLMNVCNLKQQKKKLHGLFFDREPFLCYKTDPEVKMLSVFHRENIPLAAPAVQEGGPGSMVSGGC